MVGTSLLKTAITLGLLVVLAKKLGVAPMTVAKPFTVNLSGG